MFRKILSVAVFIGFLAVIVQLASAAPTPIPPVGAPGTGTAYLMFGGKMKIDLKTALTVDFKTGAMKPSPIVDVSITAYDTGALLVGILGGNFSFSPGTPTPCVKGKCYNEGVMVMGLGETEVISGTYAQEMDTKGNYKNKFAVNIDMEPIIAALQQMLADQGLSIPMVVVQDPKNGMTGTVKIDPKYGQMVTIAFKGKFTIFVPDQEQPLLIISLNIASSPSMLGVADTSAAAAASYLDASPGGETAEEAAKVLAEILKPFLGMVK